MEWLLWLVGSVAPVSRAWMYETYTASLCLIVSLQRCPMPQWWRSSSCWSYYLSIIINSTVWVSSLVVTNCGFYGVGLVIVVSGSIRFMQIFAGVRWRGGVKWEWGRRKWRFSVCDIYICVSQMCLVENARAENVAPSRYGKLVITVMHARTSNTVFRSVSIKVVSADYYRPTLPVTRRSGEWGIVCVDL